VQLEDARTSVTVDLVDRVLPLCRFPVQSLLLIGSVAEGLANEFSDIDLLAIVKQTRSRTRINEEGFYLDDRPVSILYITESALRRRLRQLDQLYIDGGHLTDGTVTRLASARVLFDPEGIGERIVAAARRFVPRKDTLREMMRIAFGFLNDAVGSRAAGDFSTAAIMARAGASVAIDCCLLQQGERNLKPKWHLRRLARVGETGVLSSYLKVLGLDALSEDMTDDLISDTGRLMCTVLDVPSLDQFQDSQMFSRQAGQ